MNFLKSIIIFTFLLSASAFAEIKFIINSSNTSNTVLDIGYLKKVYTGEISSWTNNDQNIQVVDYKNKTSQKRKFCSDFLKISPARLYKKWIRASLEGTGEPIILLESESEMINYIKKNHLAIGYLYDKEVPEAGITVIKIK